MTTLSQDATVRLLAASQPDIIRANQKDETYVAQYVEATREVVRRLAGPFRALQYARESKLLALLLYHGLTTGLGQSTLGEEYCGMEQLAAGAGRPPGPRRRLLLALLLSVGPYVTDRLTSQLDSAAEDAAEAEAEAAMGAAAAGGDYCTSGAGGAAAAATVAAELETGLAATSGCCTGGAAVEGEAAATAAAVQAQVEGGKTAGGALPPLRGRHSEVGAAEAAAAGGEAQRGDGGGGRGAGGGGGTWVHLLVGAVVVRWTRSWRALALTWPRMRPLLSYAGRLHLAVFYAYGAYYSLAHRLAGIRYSLSIRPLQGRPSYRVLGALLGLQLAVVAALQARDALRSIRRRSAAAAAAAKYRRRPKQGGGSDGGGDEGDVGCEERLYAGEGEPAVFLDTDDDDDDDTPYDGEGGDDNYWAGRPDAADEDVKAAAEGREGRAAVSDSSSRGDSGSAGAVVEGWEEVERLDGEAASSWESDVFGVRPLAVPAPPPSPPLQLHPQPPPAPAAEPGSPRPDAPGPGGAQHRRRRGRAAAAAGGSVVPVLTSQRQCPLCLSPKSHPSSTPCGHTFCWGCITAWCVEKPECPLCRSEVRLPQLVALYHTNC